MKSSEASPLVRFRYCITADRKHLIIEIENISASAISVEGWLDGGSNSNIFSSSFSSSGFPSQSTHLSPLHKHGLPQNFLGHASRLADRETRGKEAKEDRNIGSSSSSIDSPCLPPSDFPPARRSTCHGDEDDILSSPYSSGHSLSSRHDLGGGGGKGGGWEGGIEANVVSSHGGFHVDRARAGAPRHPPSLPAHRPGPHSLGLSFAFPSSTSHCSSYGSMQEERESSGKRSLFRRSSGGGGESFIFSLRCSVPEVFFFRGVQGILDHSKEEEELRERRKKTKKGKGKNEEQEVVGVAAEENKETPASVKAAGMQPHSSRPVRLGMPTGTSSALHSLSSALPVLLVLPPPTPSTVSSSAASTLSSVYSSKIKPRAPQSICREGNDTQPHHSSSVPPSPSPLPSTTTALTPSAGAAVPPPLSSSSSLSFSLASASASSSSFGFSSPASSGLYYPLFPLFPLHPSMKLDTVEAQSELQWSQPVPTSILSLVFRRQIIAKRVAQAQAGAAVRMRQAGNAGDGRSAIWMDSSSGASSDGGGGGALFPPPSSSSSYFSEERGEVGDPSLPKQQPSSNNNNHHMWSGSSVSSSSSSIIKGMGRTPSVESRYTWDSTSLPPAAGSHPPTPPLHANILPSSVSTSSFSPSGVPSLRTTTTSLSSSFKPLLIPEVLPDGLLHPGFPIRWVLDIDTELLSTHIYPPPTSSASSPSSFSTSTPLSPFFPFEWKEATEGPLQHHQGDCYEEGDGSGHEKPFHPPPPPPPPDHHHDHQGSKLKKGIAIASKKKEEKVKEKNRNEERKKIRRRDEKNFPLNETKTRRLKKGVGKVEKSSKSAKGRKKKRGGRDISGGSSSLSSELSAFSLEEWNDPLSHHHEGKDENRRNHFHTIFPTTMAGTPSKERNLPRSSRKVSCTNVCPSLSSSMSSSAVVFPPPAPAPFSSSFSSFFIGSSGGASSSSPSSPITFLLFYKSLGKHSTTLGEGRNGGASFSSSTTTTRGETLHDRFRSTSPEDIEFPSERAFTATPSAVAGVGDGAVISSPSSSSISTSSSRASPFSLRGGEPKENTKEVTMSSKAVQKADEWLKRESSLFQKWQCGLISRMLDLEKKNKNKKKKNANNNTTSSRGTGMMEGGKKPYDCPTSAADGHQNMGVAHLPVFPSSTPSTPPPPGGRVERWSCRRLLAPVLGSSIRWAALAITHSRLPLSFSFYASPSLSSCFPSSSSPPPPLRHEGVNQKSAPLDLYAYSLAKYFLLGVQTSHPPTPSSLLPRSLLREEESNNTDEKQVLVKKIQQYLKPLRYEDTHSKPVSGTAQAIFASLSSDANSIPRPPHSSVAGTRDNPPLDDSLSLTPGVLFLPFPASFFYHSLPGVWSPWSMSLSQSPLDNIHTSWWNKTSSSLSSPPLSSSFGGEPYVLREEESGKRKGKVVGIEKERPQQELEKKKKKGISTSTQSTPHDPIPSRNKSSSRDGRSDLRRPRRISCVSSSFVSSTSPTAAASPAPTAAPFACTPSSSPSPPAPPTAAVTRLFSSSPPSKLSTADPPSCAPTSAATTHTHPPMTSSSSYHSLPPIHHKSSTTLDPLSAQRFQCLSNPCSQPSVSSFSSSSSLSTTAGINPNILLGKRAKNSSSSRKDKEMEKREKKSDTKEEEQEGKKNLRRSPPHSPSGLPPSPTIPFTPSIDGSSSADLSKKLRRGGGNPNPLPSLVIPLPSVSSQSITSSSTSTLLHSSPSPSSSSSSPSPSPSFLPKALAQASDAGVTVAQERKGNQKEKEEEGKEVKPNGNRENSTLTTAIVLPPPLVTGIHEEQAQEKVEKEKPLTVVEVKDAKGNALEHIPTHQRSKEGGGTPSTFHLHGKRALAEEATRLPPTSSGKGCGHSDVQKNSRELNHLHMNEGEKALVRRDEEDYPPHNADSSNSGILAAYSLFFSLTTNFVLEYVVNLIFPSAVFPKPYSSYMDTCLSPSYFHPNPSNHSRHNHNGDADSDFYDDEKKRDDRSIRCSTAASGEEEMEKGDKKCVYLQKHQDLVKKASKKASQPFQSPLKQEQEVGLATTLHQSVMVPVLENGIMPTLQFLMTMAQTILPILAHIFVQVMHHTAIPFILLAFIGIVWLFLCGESGTSGVPLEYIYIP